jgi:hypothetical protein
MRSLANTTTAVPPTNSEREPTLPKPVARSHPAPRRSCGPVSTPADLFGQLRHGIGDDAVLGIEAGLLPEAAADITTDRGRERMRDARRMRRRARVSQDADRNFIA